MKLTKAQRHKHYKTALKSIKENNYRMICGALRESLNLNGFMPLENIPKIFPEFKKSKPKDYNKYLGWWPYGDDEARIKVLRACIRETAPKKRKKVSNQTK